MDTELKDTLQLIISKLGDIDSNLTKTNTRLDNVEKTQAEMQLDIRAINVRIDNIEKTQAEMQLDIRAINVSLDNVEKTQEDMQLDIRAINVRIENEIIPGIKTIAAGHQMLYDKISRIDDLSDEIDELKGAIVAVEILATGKLGN